MSYKVSYKKQEQILVDDFMEVGYMAENIEVVSINKQKILLKKCHKDKSMSLFISFPSAELFLNEIMRIDQFMSDIKVPINCCLLFDEINEASVALEKKLQKFKIYFDDGLEYGNMYGTKIEQGILEGKLTKALFLISKDGAVFYVDMPEVIESSLDMQRLHVELNKAYVAYTGVGCHG